MYSYKRPHKQSPTLRNSESQPAKCKNVSCALLRKQRDVRQAFLADPGAVVAAVDTVVGESSALGRGPRAHEGPHALPLPASLAPKDRNI